MPLNHYSCRYIVLLTASVTLCAVGTNVAIAKPRISLDAFAIHSLLEHRFAAPEPIASQVEKVHALVRIRPRFNLGKGYELQSPIGAVLPFDSGADGTVKTLRTNFCLAIHRTIGRRWNIGFGPGLDWKIIIPTQESIVLRNGDSTQTFYTPGSTVTSTLIVGYFSAGWSWKDRFSLESNLYVQNLGNQSRRSFAVALGFGVLL